MLSVINRLMRIRIYYLAVEGGIGPVHSRSVTILQCRPRGDLGTAIRARVLRPPYLLYDLHGPRSRKAPGDPYRLHFEFRGVNSTIFKLAGYEFQHPRRRDMNDLDAPRFVAEPVGAV